MLSQPGAHLVTGVSFVFSRHVPSSQNMGSSLARIQGHKTVLDLSPPQIFTAHLMTIADSKSIAWSGVLMVWQCDITPGWLWPMRQCWSHQDAIPQISLHAITHCHLCIRITGHRDTHNPFRAHTLLNNTASRQFQWGCPFVGLSSVLSLKFHWK